MATDKHVSGVATPDYTRNWVPVNAATVWEALAVKSTDAYCYATGDFKSPSPIKNYLATDNAITTSDPVNPTSPTWYINILIRTSGTIEYTDWVVWVTAVNTSGSYSSGTPQINTVTTPAITSEWQMINLPMDSDWAGSGATPSGLYLNIYDGVSSHAISGQVQVAYLSFTQSPETLTTDYPQAGAASVTMSGSSSRVHNTVAEEAEVLAAVTVTPDGSETRGSVSVVGDVIYGNTVNYTFTPHGNCQIQTISIDGDVKDATYGSQYLRNNAVTIPVGVGVAVPVVVVKFVKAASALTSYTFQESFLTGIGSEDISLTEGVVRKMKKPKLPVEGPVEIDMTKLRRRE